MIPMLFSDFPLVQVNSKDRDSELMDIMAQLIS